MPEDVLTMRPRPDGNGVDMTLLGPNPLYLSAASLDRLILAMVAMRAHLNPRTQGETPENGTEVMSGPELSWAIGPGQEEGTSQLALFHPGLGWWGLDLNVAETLRAAGILAEVVSDMRGAKPN